jgi:arylsulfatase A
MAASANGLATAGGPDILCAHHPPPQMLSLFRLCLALAILIGAGPSLIRGADAPITERPNILLILADDLGVEGLGCYGGLDYRTPHLDRLAATGARFTHAYAQPLCTPTRLQLMTGKYNQRNWVAFGIMDPREKTLGHFMRDAGYKTCLAGKWQFWSYDPPEYPGAAQRRGIGMKVEDAGFDAYSVWHAFHTEDKGSRYANPTVYQNGEFVKNTDGKYGDDLWVEFIADFMDRNRAGPVFAFYAMALTHWPMVPTPNSADWRDPAKRLVEDVRHFKDMVEYADTCVGRLLARLEALKLRDNTIVIFCTDNGTDLRISSRTKAGVVRGGKGLPTDNGIHVPLIVNWPNRIRSSVISDLVDSTDFLPTIAELAGAKLPAAWGADGVSFAPRLFGRPGRPREWAFFWHDPRPGWDKEKRTRHIFALDHQFKLYSDGRFYDLSADLAEQHSLVAASLTALQRAARSKLAAVIAQQMKDFPEKF